LRLILALSARQGGDAFTTLLWSESPFLARGTHAPRLPREDPGSATTRRGMSRRPCRRPRSDPSRGRPVRPR